MNIILLLIPLSIILLALGIWAFFWAVNHSQFDDLETPGLSPLADDGLPLSRTSDLASLNARDTPDGVISTTDEMQHPEAGTASAEDPCDEHAK